MAYCRLAVALVWISGAIALESAVFHVQALGTEAVKSTPIDKVISLIDGLKKEVEVEGKAEAATYDKLACFCKATTETKVKSIKKGNEKINVLSADIADKTQAKANDATEFGERQSKQEQLSAELVSAKSRFAKERAQYDEAGADVTKALSSIRSAIKSLKDSAPKAASFLQGGVHDQLVETLNMAKAINLVSNLARYNVASLLQGAGPLDPEDPEYDYHSKDIIKLLEGLATDFSSQKKALDDDHAKKKKASDDLKLSTQKQMAANSDAMKALDKNMGKLAKEIAAARQSLVEQEDNMKDDELYLKDLTSRCEARAEDWDQRAQMRNDEIAALSSALKILGDSVKGAADKVNVRAFIQHPSMPRVMSKQTLHDEQEASSFLQVSLQQRTSKAFLARSHTSQDVLRKRALVFITNEGQRLGSLVLTSLAARAATAPLKKVEDLLQGLVERLVEESKAEATKKGFCNEELGKAEKERDFRFEDTQDTSSEVKSLEAKRDELTQEIKELSEDITSLTKADDEATKDRSQSKTENLATIKTATGGLESVNEALLLLRSFYKQAAKASFIQASPVDEDTKDAGFAGAYTGKQSGSHAVLDLLETIASDFERTIRRTEQAETSAQREYQDWMDTTTSSMGSKKTKKKSWTSKI
jgi:hypothetical protein